MSVDTDGLPTSLAPHVYKSYVHDAAGWLDDGLFAIGELEVPEELAEYGVHEERFFADVRARADEDHEPEPETDDKISQTGRIDWGALFKEFSFHVVDANGRHAIPEGPLVEAVWVSAQGIAGNGRTHVTRAVETGALTVERTVAENGEPTLRGYRCPEVHPDAS